MNLRVRSVTGASESAILKDLFFCRGLRAKKKRGGKETVGEDFVLLGDSFSRFQGLGVVSVNWLDGRIGLLSGFCRAVLCEALTHFVLVGLCCGSTLGRSTEILLREKVAG